MTRASVWDKQLKALEGGEMDLFATAEDMSAYANYGVYELKQYIRALECGYRKLKTQLAVERELRKLAERRCKEVVQNGVSD